MGILRILLLLVVWSASGMSSAEAARVGERSPARPGLWWDPQRSGMGFEIHPAGSGLFVIWFTYRDDGSAIWYTAQDDSIVDGRFDGPLLQHRWQGGRHAGYVEAGRLELTIENPERLKVRVTQPARIASDFTIEPFPTSGVSPEVDHSGAWYQHASGGYGVTVSEQGTVIVAAYYAYDAAGQPVWYFGDNRGAGDRVTLNRFTARCPACARPDPQADAAGTLVLGFQGESAMRVRLDMATALVAPEWRLDERALEMLTRPASQRPADRQLASFDDDDMLGRFIREGLLDPRLAPIAVDFSPPPIVGTYSETNLQETGVDEAGVIKNDAARVFTFVGAPNGRVEPRIRSVWVVDAGASILSQPSLVLTGYETLGAQDLGLLYLTADRLVAITGTAPRYYASMGFAPSPTDYQNGTTRVEVFDRTSVGQPRSLWYASFDGYYVTSRRIGDSMYLIMRSTSFVEGARVYSGTASELETARARVEAAPLDTLLPGVRIGTGERQRLLEAADVLLPPTGSRPPSPEFATVVRIPLATPAVADAIAIAGGVDAHYVSSTHLYVATTRHDYAASPLGDRFRPGFITTDVHRLDLDRPTLEAGATGRVEGALNRYSDRAAFRFSEHDNRLRIVTGAYNLWGDLGQNRLTILEPSATSPGVLRTLAYLPNAQRRETIGKPDELLYDTRFVGDRLYAVTFLKTDPLYVVDMSVPSDPKIAGSLEVPGFSDYLHPLAGDLLLGVGKGARPAATGGDNQFAWYQGLQVSLFDVSDAGRPVELQRVELGKRGSETALLQHHHAFSGVASSGGLDFAIPMRLHEPLGTEPPTLPDNHTYPWSRSGLFRFSVSGSGTGARLETRAPLITYRRDGAPLPDYQDHAGYGDARSVLYPRGVVYVEGGRFWHLDTSVPAAAHTGPM